MSGPTLITPPARWPGLGLREMWRMRRTCLVLAQRSLRVRYRQMLLGVAWVLIQPLVLMAVISVFFSLLMRNTTMDLPFPVFIFCALVVWRVVLKVVNEGGSSIVANGSLVQRIYLPRAFFPLSVALASLSDLFFNVLALLALLAYFGIIPGIGLLALPLLLAVAYAAGLGVAFAAAALNARYRDVELVVPLLVQAWFFSSPIIYPSTLVPEDLRLLYHLNPLVLVMDGFRWAFTRTPAPPLEAWLVSGGAAALMLLAGYLLFRYREPELADHL